MPKPLLLSVNPEYFYRILDWKNQPYQQVGNLVMVQGFDRYNQLIKLNAVFSTLPTGDPIDRTQTVTGPFNFAVPRPWRLPSESLTLQQVFERRVNQLLSTQQQLNICWSGGTDSTALLSAFLMHATNLDQLRVLYSPFSLYENREFFEYVQKNFPALQWLDISGDVYLHTVFEGILINGHGGDEFTASLDQSFFESLGPDGLRQPWQNLITDSTLMEFCQDYFALAQRPVETVLEARWWFYAATKNSCLCPKDSILSATATTIAFYDCYEFEDYVWNNTDQIMSGPEYKDYKKFLKQYIYDFDKNSHYYYHARKSNSEQLDWYVKKKTHLLGQQWIAYLSDRTVIATPNLPLFSQLEFERTYGNSLEYLFNHP